MNIEHKIGICALSSTEIDMSGSKCGILMTASLFNTNKMHRKQSKSIC